jgi:hypothetical protein
MRHAAWITKSAVALAVVALGLSVGLLPAEAKGAPPGKGGGGGSKGSDKSAPTLVVPADITVDAIAPMGRLVGWTVTATDDKDPAPVVTSSPASGSVFPVGKTTVTVTAKDSAGHTTTGTFNVTVRPMPGPTSYKAYWSASLTDDSSSTWFVWDITVAPDGTVSGSGRQTWSIELVPHYWYNGDAAFVVFTPPTVAGTGVVSGTIAPDGSCQLVSSSNYWYSIYDAESGDMVLQEGTGGFSGSMTVRFWGGSDLDFSGYPLDPPEFAGSDTLWRRQ